MSYSEDLYLRSSQNGVGLEREWAKMKEADPDAYVATSASLTLPFDDAGLTEFVDTAGLFDDTAYVDASVYKTNAWVDVSVDLAAYHSSCATGDYALTGTEPSCPDSAYGPADDDLPGAAITSPQVKTEGAPPGEVLRNILVYIPLPDANKGVLICTVCGYGQPNSTWRELVRHWRPRNHGASPRVSAEERAMAQEVWEQHTETAIRADSDWTLPSHPIAPVAHVRVEEASVCSVQDCRLRYVVQWTADNKPADHAWREHLRKEHNIVESLSYGRPGISSIMWRRAEGNLYETDGEAQPPLVHVQRLFRLGRYHEVHGPSPKTTTTSPSDSDAPSARYTGHSLKDVLEDLAKTRTRRDKQRQQIIAGPAEYQVNPWAREAGFSQHLEGKEWTNARRIADKPDLCECPEAVAAWALTRTALRKSHDTLKGSPDSRFLCQLINQFHPGQSRYKPWEAYRSSSALADHSRTLQQCMALFVRTQLDAEARRAVPQYTVNSELAAALDAWLTYARSDNTAQQLATVHAKPGAENELSEGEHLTLRLLLKLLQQRDHMCRKYPGPMKVALLVLGIVPGKCRFYEANDYSRLLAGFMKMSRCAVAKCLMHETASDAEMTSVVEGCLQWGSNHVMHWAGSIKALAKAIDRTTPRRGRLIWIPAEEVMIYGEHRLSLSQLRLIVHGLVKEMETVLCEDLLLVPNLGSLPVIPLSKITDQLNYKPRGSCWTDPLNAPILTPIWDWMMEHMSEVENTQGPRFMHAKYGHALLGARIEYEKAMRSFRNAAAASAVFAIGVSIRGTTLSNYRWRNSDNGDELRNLVVQDGRLTLLGGWTKNSWAGAEAPLHVLPAELAKLWAWYVALVLPFWDLLSVDVPTEHRILEDDCFLFAPDRGRSTSDSQWVSKALKDATSTVVKPGFGLQPGRQLAIGFARKYMPADMLAGGKSLHLDAPRERQGLKQAVLTRAGGLTTQRAENGPDQFSGANNSDEDEDEDNGYDREEELRAWQDDTLTSESAPKDLGGIGKEVFDDIREQFRARSAVEMMCGHTTSVGYTHYGGSAAAIPGLDELTLSLWSCVSDYWHWVLHFPSACDKFGASGGKRRGTNVPRHTLPEDADSTIMPAESLQGALQTREADVPRPPRERAKFDKPGTSRDEALPLLRRMVGDDQADFHKCQWEALDVILNQPNQSLTVVMPTGAGKSLLFMLPALRYPGQITVVLTPLSALREDLKQKCMRLQIEFVDFDGSDGMHMEIGWYASVSIVFASVEHLGQPRFREVLQTLAGAGLVRHMVLDEAHLVVTQQHWRQNLANYKHLATFGVPMVFLSATLPLVVEAQLYRGMGVDASFFAQLRSSTVRPTLSYRVVHLAPALGQEQPRWWGNEDLVVYLKRERPVLLPEGQRKTIVFVNNTETVESLAPLFKDGYAYHSRLATPDRAKVLAAFSTTKDSIIFSTCALENGLDRDDIGLVFHVGPPDDMLAYMQGAGRAGRGGQKAVVILLAGYAMTPRLNTKNKERLESARIMSEYLQEGQPLESARCRRCVIDEYMDGVYGRDRCRKEDGEELCDVCLHHAQRGVASSSATIHGLGPLTPRPGKPRDLDQRCDVDLDSTTPPKRQPVRGSCYTSSQSSYQRSLPSSYASPGTPESSTSRSSLGVLRNHSDAKVSSTPPETFEQSQDAVSPIVAIRPGPKSLKRAADWGKGKRLSTLERIEAVMDFWKSNCPSCIMESKPDYGHHKNDCEANLWNSQKRICREANQWTTPGGWRCAPHSCCYTCKLPTRLSKCFEKPGVRCLSPYKRLFGDAWAVCRLRKDTRAWYNNHMSKELQSDVPFDLLDEKAYLGDISRGGEKVTVLIELLVRMTEKFFLRTYEHPPALAESMYLDRELKRLR